MGKIHERLKQRQQALHKRTQASSYKDVPGVSSSTLAKLNKFLIRLEFAKRQHTNVRDRHETMQELAAAASALGLKGRWNLLCNVTQCLAEGATWYNRGSYAYYCPSCAVMLNRENAKDPYLRGNPLCRAVTEEEHLRDDLHLSKGAT